MARTQGVETFTATLAKMPDVTASTTELDAKDPSKKDAAATVANFEAARTVMRKFSTPLGIAPSMIVVNTDNHTRIVFPVWARVDEGRDRD